MEEKVVTGFARIAGLTFLSTFIGINLGRTCFLGGRMTLEVVDVLVFTMLLLSDIT